MKQHKRTTKTRTKTVGQVAIPLEIRPLLQQIGRLAAEQGMRVYAVGGCVRDWVLGITKTVDLDVVVEGDGIAFANTLGRVLRASVTLHEQFGTATLELPVAKTRGAVRGRPAAIRRLDVASCRKEVYVRSAAYPKVAPGTLRDDLFRRDFTINAMAMAITPRRFGVLIDPFGGWKDLQARRLRILHPASFLDDPSRMLRAVRFVQRLGLSVETHTARRLKEALAQGALERLNAGRIRKELDRIAHEPDPAACRKRWERWLAT